MRKSSFFHFNTFEIPLKIEVCFTLTDVLKHTGRMWVGKIWWLQILTSEKSTVLLKEWMRVFYRNNYGTSETRSSKQPFLEINILLLTAEKTTQTMDDCKFSRQNKYITLQRMDDCHSFCGKTDTLLQGMDDCNYTCVKNRPPLKYWMFKIGLPKK